METPLPPPPAEEASPRRRSLIPADQDQKAALAEFLAKAWADNPQLVLIWITQAEFAGKATAFAATLRTRNKAGALAPQRTLSFQEYDQQIREGLNSVKGYLEDKYGKAAAKSYFAEFGIETRHDTYELPRAQSERALALDDLVAALSTHGFAANRYGTTYWEPIAAGYAELAGTARKARATVSELVGQKNAEETVIDDVLSAMIALVEAQYRTPDAYHAKLRELGYQREYN